MKSLTFKGTMSSAYGKTLEATIPFEGSYKAYENYSEIPESLQPDEDAKLNLVNNNLKAAARQKAMTAALDAAGIEKPTLETDVALQLATLKKVFLASGKYTEETALAQAKAALGITE